MKASALPYSANIARVVDAYGRIEAQIEKLMLKREKLVAEIAGWGSGDYEGYIYEVGVRRANGQSIEIGTVRIVDARQATAISCRYRDGRKISRHVL